MPRCESSAPRKKLPPPTTIATCDAGADDLGDLPGDGGHDVGVDAELAAAEDLAGELEQHPAVRRSVSAAPSAPDAAKAATVPAPSVDPCTIAASSSLDCRC